MGTQLSKFMALVFAATLGGCSFQTLKFDTYNAKRGPDESRPYWEMPHIASKSVLPQGNQLIDWIPFNFGPFEGGFHIWSGRRDSNGNLEEKDHTLTIQVHAKHVVRAYTIMNTYCGNADVEWIHVAFIFKDANGSLVGPEPTALKGNRDIRDYYQNVYTNAISGDAPTKPKQVWKDGTTNPNGGGGDNSRLDLQTYEIPAKYWDMELDHIEVRDTGKNDGEKKQRALVLAATVKMQAWKPEEKP